jgi:hypothetical protein
MTPHPKSEAKRPATAREPQPARPPAAKPQARPPAPPAPAPDIHNAKTMIIDRKTGKPIEGRQKRHPGSPGGRDPRELDPAIHDAPTKIIRK